MKLIEVGGLQVEQVLHDFVVHDALQGSGVSAGQLWSGYAKLVADLGPRNRTLLNKRDNLQATIDSWLQASRGRDLDPVAYEAFLRDVGYLLPEPPPFTITTANVDAEIAHIAGPQLVV